MSTIVQQPFNNRVTNVQKLLKNRLTIFNNRLTIV